MYRSEPFRRGGWRARSGYREITYNHQEDEVPDFPSVGGPLLLSLAHEDLVSGDKTSTEVKITDCYLAASYNWPGRGNNQILIPGAPSCWMPPSTPVTLKQDSGQYFRDINAARLPDFPMEAALRATLDHRPELDLDAIDLIACNSTLGNLLRFARNVAKPFRFWVEIIGRTAVFVRMERSPRELLSNVWGYGHTFPKAYTHWPREVEGSESHQRVLQYKLADMKMLVRFNGDGYLPNLISEHLQFSWEDPSIKRAGSHLDQLTSGARDRWSLSPDEKLVLVHSGRRIPQKAIFDLKTRSIKKKELDILSEELPRLWISQIPNFILAFHKNGRFEDISVEDITPKIQTWEQDNQDDLRKFIHLIQAILKTAADTTSKKLEVRSTLAGKLELREICGGNWSALPQDLRSQWRSTEEDRNEGEQLTELGLSLFDI